MSLDALFATVALFAVCLAPTARGGGTAHSPSLEHALEAIETEHIRKDVAHLASDELGGRDTPSAGLEAAAHYLRGRLVELGFEAGAAEGYFYEYPLSHLQLDGARTQLALVHGSVRHEFKLGTDYYIGRTSEAADYEIAGQLVYGGNWDQLEQALRLGTSAELKGRWVLLTEAGGTVRKITEEIQERGALGLAFVESASEDKPYAERFARTTASLLDARAGRLDENRKLNAVFPKIFLPTASLNKVLELAGHSTAPAAGTLLEVELAEARHLTNPGGRAMLKNVCGYWPGSDPKLREEVIILSAHYDHVGKRGDEVWNGADDNASGTTGLLALASALKAYGPMRRSILLMWVSAEEKGLLGSEAWTKCPWLPGNAFPVANINMDMIGRNAPQELLVTPTRALEGEFNGLTLLVEKFAPVEGFSELKSADEYWFRSDQVNFARNLGLPVAFLFCDVHEDYHQPTDTADKIDCDKLRRVVRLVLRVLDGMQADELKLHERELPGALEFDLMERRGTAQRVLERVRSSVDAYLAWNAGRLPGSLEELLQFEGGGRDWYPDNRLPKDPWGRDYAIQLPSAGAEARYGCLGADGEAGGEGADADIVLN